MKISRVFAHRVDLPLVEGSYKWSGGKSVSVFDSTIVGVETQCGLTKTRQARDLCVSMGIAMTLEDSWGGDITTATIAHLAHSTPEELRFTSTDFNSYVTLNTADGAPRRECGHMRASAAPGLGVTPKLDVLGPRVVEVA